MAIEPEKEPNSETEIGEETLEEIKEEIEEEIAEAETQEEVSEIDKTISSIFERIKECLPPNLMQTLLDLTAELKEANRLKAEKIQAKLQNVSPATPGPPTPEMTETPLAPEILEKSEEESPAPVEETRRQRRVKL
jgi:hypothetical protein